MEPIGGGSMKKGKKDYSVSALMSKEPTVWKAVFIVVDCRAIYLESKVWHAHSPQILVEHTKTPGGDTCNITN